MAKRLNCISAKVWALCILQKNGRWEKRIIACDREALKLPAKFYREEFGKKVKIVRA